MRQLVATLLVFLIGVGPSFRLYAADNAEKQTSEVISNVGVDGLHTIELTPKRITVDGVDGLWFPEDQTARILIRLSVYEELKALAEAQEILISSQKTAIRTATTALDVQVQLTEEQKARGDAFKADDLQTKIELAEEKAKNDSIIRSPIVWGLLGALTVGVVYFLTKPTASSVQVVN